MIQLDFPAKDAAAALDASPSEVGYSQHNGAEGSAWDDSKLEKVDGTHPVVYPAEGSHANYYEPALYLGSSAAEGVGCDNTQGPSQELRPAVQLVPPDRTEMLQKYPWLGFQGHWGEQHPAFYNGPTGPTEHPQWSTPITWAQTSWHPTAFAIPSGVTGAPSATDLFCSVVTGGSTLLTKAIAGGPAVFLAVLGLLLLALWTAFRMQWRPSQPFQLARRRALGQILSASLRMYRHNPLMYLTIGALFLPASIVIALLQRLLFALTQLDVLSQVAGPTNAFVAGSALAIGLVFGVITLTLVQAMVAISVSHAADATELLPRHAYAVIKGRIPSLMAALVVMFTAVVLLQLTVVAMPIAIWLLVRWSLFAQCIVLEDLPGARDSRAAMRWCEVTGGGWPR